MLKIFLYICAKIYLSKNRNKIIAVTGSIGKTVSADMIKQVLSDKYQVRLFTAHNKNISELCMEILKIKYNHTFGSWRAAWAMAASETNKIVKDKTIFIFELSTEKLGFFKKQIRLINPDISIITNITKKQLSANKSIKDSIDEIGYILKKLNKDGTAIINFDDHSSPILFNMIKISKVMTVGYGKGASIQAMEINSNKDGLKFMIKIKKYLSEIQTNIIGIHNIYPILISLAVGLEMGISANELVKTIKKIKVINGRMNLIHGINRSKIINASSTSSPTIISTGVDMLNLFENKNKIAVLGDMCDLSIFTEGIYANTISRIANRVDYIVCIGPMMKSYACKELWRMNFPETKISCFDDQQQANKFLSKKINAKDIVLVAGSKKMNLNNLVKKLSQ